MLGPSVIRRDGRVAGRNDKNREYKGGRRMIRYFAGAVAAVSL